jgi:hypothetical protein
LSLNKEDYAAADIDILAYQVVLNACAMLENKESICINDIIQRAESNVKQHLAKVQVRK